MGVIAFRGLVLVECGRFAGIDAEVLERWEMLGFGDFTWQIGTVGKCRTCLLDIDVGWYL